MKKINLEKLLSSLIEIPSYVSEKCNEAKLADYIEAFVQENTSYKVISQKVENERRNLIIKGDTDPKVILFGHMDTVMPKSKDPFKPVQKEDKLYGLGAIDMKSGVAVMLNQLFNFEPDKGLCLVLTVDEEYDFKGAEKLVLEYNFNPDYIINLEPSDLKILQGCRGITEFSFEIIGKTSHAARKDLGINAIEATMNIYKTLEQKLGEINKKSTSGINTLNIAYLEGGTLSDKKELICAANIVPNYAKTTGELRISHKEITKDFVENILASSAKSEGAQLRNLKFKFYLGSMFTEKNKIKDFEKAIKESGLPVEYADFTKTGFFEVQMLNEKWGGSTIIFGPGPSDKCHMEDEYVSLETLHSTNEVIESFLNNQLK